MRDEDFTVSYNLRLIFSAMLNRMLGTHTELHSEPQRMIVLGAGFGRTGTSSLLSALEKLGLRAYHMREGVVRTPGHAVLWADLARLDSSAKTNSTAIQETRGRLFELMARDGFNATTDFPACLLTAELLKRYPEARVVLSVRASGEVWADSVLSTIARFRPILSYPPYTFASLSSDFLSIDSYVWSTIGAPVDPSTGYPRRPDLAAAHDAWIAEMKRTIPRDQLLVHQAKDGWAPLCAFLSPANPIIRSSCDAILASGEAYPHVNDAALMQRVQLALKVIKVAFWTAPLLVIFMCVLFRRGRAHDSASKGRGTKARNRPRKAE